MGKIGRPPMDVDKARRDYENGASIRAVAAASGYCYGTVYKKLQDAGVVFRPPGGNRRRPPREAAQSDAA